MNTYSCNAVSVSDAKSLSHPVEATNAYRAACLYAELLSLPTGAMVIVDAPDGPRTYRITTSIVRMISAKEVMAARH